MSDMSIILYVCKQCGHSYELRTNSIDPPVNETQEITCENCAPIYTPPTSGPLPPNLEEAINA